MAVCDISVYPKKDGTDSYALVDQIIHIIEQSGLKYEVNAMSTAVEGSSDQLFELAKKCHKHALAIGCTSVMTTLRLQESLTHDTTIAGKTTKFKK